MNPSNILNFTMWTIFDLFDDIYFDLKLILMAIEMDNLAALLEPELPTFNPFKTIGKYYWKSMPASWSSSLSSFSVSPQWLFLAGSPHLSFSNYLEQFETNNGYEELMVTLFEQHDFILKTNSMQHITQLIRHFQDEIDEQWNYLWSLFEEMEQGGLHQLLDKDYVWDNGTIWWWWGVHFTPQTKDNVSLPCQWSSTPYPHHCPALSSSSSWSVPIQHSPIMSEVKKNSLSLINIKKPNLKTQQNWFVNLADIVARQWAQEHSLSSASSSSTSSYHTLILGTYGNPIIVLDDWDQGFWM